MVAGVLLGSTGLAAALPGSLPEQAGSVAKSALQAVNLMKDEKDAAKEQRKADRAAAKAENGVERFTEGCTAGDPPTPFTGTHGQYVKAHPDLPETPDVNEREEAAESDCGKPMTSVGKPDRGDEKEGGEEEAGTTPGKGNNGKGNGNGAGAGSAGAAPDEAGSPTDTGRPEHPEKSEATPPTTVTTQQGSDEGDASPGRSGEAGEAGDNRQDGLGPPTSGS